MAARHWEKEIGNDAPDAGKIRVTI
jgi:hypothetical protein